MVVARACRENIAIARLQLAVESHDAESATHAMTSLSTLLKGTERLREVLK